MVMDVTAKHLKILFNVNPGVLNPKKLESLANAFSNEEFPVKMSPEAAAPVFFMLNPGTGEGLVIDQERITYQLDSQTGVSPNADRIISLVRTAFQTLLLEDSCAGGAQIVGNVPSLTGDSMQESLQKFIKVNISWPDVKGVGLRFLFPRKESMWEYKVEPLIADPGQFFIEMICNYNNPQHYQEIIVETLNAFEEFVGPRNGNLKEIF